MRLHPDAMPGYQLLVVVFVWLLVCAVQDWRRREVGNWLTLPPFVIAIGLRMTGFVHEPLLPVLVMATLLVISWRQGWIGGADLKASLTLAILSMQTFTWAWAGLFVWSLGLRIYHVTTCIHRMPAFVGFTVGIYIFLMILILR